MMHDLPRLNSLRAFEAVPRDVRVGIAGTDLSLPGVTNAAQIFRRQRPPDHPGRRVPSDAAGELNQTRGEDP